MLVSGKGGGRLRVDEKGVRLLVSGKGGGRLRVDEKAAGYR